MRASWLRRFGAVAVIVLVLSVLLIPAASAAAPVAGAGCPAVSYRIVRGDNLTKIAWRYGVTVSQLMRWNGITNPDRIYWGRVLTIYPAYCVQPKPQPKPQPPPPPQPKPGPQPGPDHGPWPGQGSCSAPPCWPSPITNPCCPDRRTVITSPVMGQHVSGMVTITGVAIHENFKYYKLEYGAGSSPTTWSWFFGGQWPIWNGNLGVLNSDALPSGTYTLRLTVVDQTSNYPPPCLVTIVVR